MKSLELLEELKEEINNSPKSVFSSKKSLDSEMILEIVEDLLTAFPAEFEEAQKIIDEKQKILDEAKADAIEIIRKAEDELTKRISEDEIIKAAEEKAEDLMKKANSNAKEITVGAKEYADDIMQELEIYFSDYLKLIRKNRMQLSGQQKKEPPKP